MTGMTGMTGMTSRGLNDFSQGNSKGGSAYDPFSSCLSWSVSSSIRSAPT